MRILIVDNHDSYTYNLAHLVGAVTGDSPTVIPHDQLCDPRIVREFSAVLISPGPGTPDSERDFAGSSAVLREAARLVVPVLGVCLGHQGIATSYNARVERAPAPRHGHVSTVAHNGDDMFRGIPEKFEAVRYHSLHIPSPLDGDLLATAWAEDGVLMALRHKRLPFWGVQFHPESVLSQHGESLVRNFLALVEETPEGDGVPVAPAFSNTGSWGCDVGELAEAVCAETAFSSLFEQENDRFWLDSGPDPTGEARFTVMGAAGPHGFVADYALTRGSVVVKRPDGRTLLEHPGDIFDFLKRELQLREFQEHALPLDVVGAWFGYFGYELKADTGADLAHASPDPDAQWVFPTRLVLIDQKERRTYLVALTPPGRTQGPAKTWLEQSRTAVTGSRHGQRDPEGGKRAPAQPVLVEWRDSQEQYVAAVRRCIEELHAGESYEICLTTAVRAHTDLEGLALFHQLRRSNPVPYAAYLRLGGTEVACSSPERFLRIDAEGWVEAKPIKGTAARLADPVEDRLASESLANDAKSRAENLMIVDLLRNDLSQVCEVGTVVTPKLMAVESYATVHQLVSTVRGRLRPGADSVDAVRACFPGGSMTGAPKKRTMEIIDRLEGAARGVYSGSIGYFAPNGTADLNIVIRTAVRERSAWRIGAGGAVVLDSDPVAEHQEVLLKADSVLRAIHEATRRTFRPAKGAAL